MDVPSVITTLLRDGFILVFNQNKLDIVKTAQALRAAGVNNMEVTCRIRRPLEALRRVREAMPDFAAGMASLIDSPQMLERYNQRHPDDPLPSVEQVVEAGVCYLVSAANFRAETFEAFNGKVPIIPGCGSVNEIIDQYSKGANLCKVFPAKQLGGPAFIKAIDAPIHKTIGLVPMGGTNATTMCEYMQVGVLIVGGSFSMIYRETLEQIIEKQDYDLLTRELTVIKQRIDRVRRQVYPDLDFANASLEEISQATGRDFNIH